MILKCCKGIIHEGKPKDCPGIDWCDCQHRLPLEVKIQQMKEQAR